MMKKIVLIVSLCIGALTIHAQSIYDAAKIIDKDFSGSARFVGMGGAMGALGGDLSTMRTNPAGIGIYRSNDAAATIGFTSMELDANYIGNKDNHEKNRFSFDNIGFVFSTKMGDYTALRYLNFGFNYQRGKSFYKNMSMGGLLNRGPNDEFISQTFMMAQQAEEMGVAGINTDTPFEDDRLGWLGALGYYGGLVHDFGEDGYGVGNFDTPNSEFYSKESGGIDQYDFNVALNLNDRFYLGLTIGAYDVNYKKYSIYDEDLGGANEDGTNSQYSQLQSFNRISGSGFDFKLGAIVRPFEYSPLRIGMAIHSPTFYKLTLETRSILRAGVWQQVGVEGEEITEEFKEYHIDTFNEETSWGGNMGNMLRDYDFRTPWVYNLSLGYTVGSQLALGAEYEYKDYSSLRFTHPDGGRLAETAQREQLKGVNAIRLGAEFRPISEFAFRIGYNFNSAIFKENAAKVLPVNSISTDTDFSNSKSSNIYTIGMGYSGKRIYADLAYMYRTAKESFKPFNDSDLSYTDVKDNRSKVFLTMGVRF